MYPIKTPNIITYFFQDYWWKLLTHHKEIYLTFDDGPTPEVTDEVLSLLKIYRAQATFFCVGQQIEKYPLLFKKIVQEGHTIGNHTYTHLHGWYAPPKLYIEEIEKTSAIIQKLVGYKPRFFRPPYGKFSPSVKKYIQKKYQIVMWDVLSGDFDPQTTPEDCITNVLSTFDKGSIIVLHDSLKVGKKLLDILPTLLSFFANNHYKMLSLDQTYIYKHPV